jgi:hypothetical protein
MVGQLPDEGVRKHHDDLIKAIPDDLKGVLQSTSSLQDNFRQIHTHAEQISRTAFEPVKQQARKMQPSHLVEHIDAVLTHALDLKRSVMPDVQRIDMAPSQVQSQFNDIASIRALVEENIHHVADIRRHLDEFLKKLTRLEDMYRR